jgi:hypothetical protein
MPFCDNYLQHSHKEKQLCTFLRHHPVLVLASKLSPKRRSRKYQNSEPTIRQATIPVYKRKILEAKNSH